jgi:hypothetical protein
MPGVGWGINIVGATVLYDGAFVARGIDFIGISVSSDPMKDGDSLLSMRSGEPEGLRVAF